MRRIVPLIGTATLVVLGCHAAVASSGGGFVIGNVDIRALEPPVDVTEKQLRAQGTPTVPEGRFAVRHHGRLSRSSR